MRMCQHTLYPTWFKYASLGAGNLQTMMDESELATTTPGSGSQDATAPASLASNTISLLPPGRELVITLPTDCVRHNANRKTCNEQIKSKRFVLVQNKNYRGKLSGHLISIIITCNRPCLPRIWYEFLKTLAWCDITLGGESRQTQVLWLVAPLAACTLLFYGRT